MAREPTVQQRLDRWADRNRRTVTSYNLPPKPSTPESTKTAVFGALSGLQQDYDRKYAEAKSANEQRYQQLLRIADQTTGQRAADIRGGGAAEESNVQQRLRQLGMSGTTIAPTLRAGVRRETESSLNRLADTMQQTKLGIIERRQDAYPDRSEITNLVSSIGTGQQGDLLPSTLGALSGTGGPGGVAPAGANTSLSAAQYRSKYGV